VGRSDPDDCLVDDFRPITENRGRLRQEPVGYEKQSSERASDETEILSQGQSQSLSKL
jgi:hypothetical protein